MTTDPNVGVAGNRLTQTWIMHDASQSEHCYSMFHYTSSHSTFIFQKTSFY